MHRGLGLMRGVFENCFSETFCAWIFCSHWSIYAQAWKNLKYMYKFVYSQENKEEISLIYQCFPYSIVNFSC